MADPRSIARRASLRLALRTGVDTLGPALLAGAALGALLVLADRLAGPGLPAWLLVGAPALVALSWSAWRVWRLRRGAVSAAATVDEALALHDRLSAAIELEPRFDTDPFARLAVEDARAVAPGVRVRSAIPIAFDWTWWAWPTLLAAAIVIAATMPSLHLLDRDHTAQEALLVEQSAQAASDIREARLRAEEAQREGATPEELLALEEALQQLEDGLTAPDEARSRVAEALEDIASRVEAVARRQEQAADALEDRLRELEQEDSAAAPLRDALRSGDMQEASRAMQRLRDEIQRMEGEDRQRALDAIDRLADELSQPDPDAEPGVDEPSPEQAREQMLEQGADPQQAERAADQARRRQEERDARRQAQEESQRLGEALREAARRQRQQDQRAQDQQQRQQQPREGQQREGQQQQQQQQQGDPQGDPMECASEAIDDMGQRQGEAGEQRRSAQQLREESQRIADGMSPEERERAERWADALARESRQDSSERAGRGERQPAIGVERERPDQTSTEDVDARQRGQDDRVVAEWYTPGQERSPDDPDAQASRRRLRDAADAAERAVEDQGVPARYRDLVKRYFRRLPELAPDQEPEQAPPPPPPAQDARPRG